MKYTFVGFKGTDNETTVEALDEATARRLAMEARWGRRPPAALVIKAWSGRALDLRSVP